MTREEAHQLVDDLFDGAEGPNEITASIVENSAGQEATVVEEPPKREVPEGKKAVRTKSGGDRVYYLDESRGTRQWVTNPQILEALGFGLDDVVEVEDSELLKYQMGPALYRAPNEDA